MISDLGTLESYVEEVPFESSVWFSDWLVIRTVELYTHTHIHNCFTAVWILSGTTQVSLYQKKHSLAHTYRGHQLSIVCFFRLIWSMASSLFNPCTWQSFSTIYFQVFFGLLLGLASSTSYSMHFFTQSLSSFCNTCPCHRSLLCCSTKIMSSNPSLSLYRLLGILSCSFTSHIHLTILISARWSATSFSFLTSGCMRGHADTHIKS